MKTYILWDGIINDRVPCSYSDGFQKSSFLNHILGVENLSHNSSCVAYIDVGFTYSMKISSYQRSYISQTSN